VGTEEEEEEEEEEDVPLKRKRPAGKTPPAFLLICMAPYCPRPASITYTVCKMIFKSIFKDIFSR